MRRWLAGALVLSLLFHGGLVVFFFRHQLEGFGMNTEQLAPPRAFNMKRVSIPEIPPPDEARLKLPVNAPNVARIEVPSDKPTVQEVRMSPQTPDLSKQVINEKPRVEMNWEQLAKAEAASRSEMERSLGSAAAAAIKESARLSPRQAVLTLPPGFKDGDGTGAGGGGIPGMKSLDDLIAQTGPLHAGDKAGMPGGALFEYNSYELRPDSVEKLRMLAALIQRNPTATFSIEGHTDSFGTPDYNQRLSEQRAESVKQWLVEVMGIAPERIQTNGLGNTRPLVSADRTKEEQGPNRRVEIVVKTSRKS